MNSSSYRPVITDARAALSLTAEVLVAGGGAAGVAAAVTAARQGCRVVLVERYGFCGGGAVAGLSGTVCGLYEASEFGMPRQVVYGFADEFVQKLRARNGLSEALRYGKTFTHVHDPLVWREVGDFLLHEAGVTVIFHATVTDVLIEGDRVCGVQLYTKQGKVLVHAAIAIDATGDADLAAMAGLPTWMGDYGHVQNPTMIFRLGGVDIQRFSTTYGKDTIMPASVSTEIANANGRGYRLPRTKIWLFPTTRPHELLCNCTRITGADGRDLNTTFFRDFTEAESEGRAQVREYARFFRDHLAGCEECWVNDTGVQVGVRQTRQAAGVKTLRTKDVRSAAKHADGIARSPWPIELHTGGRPRLEWLLNDFYEIPFGCFVPERGDGLLVAGRCLSAEHEAVASARVTAQCFSYGHAIGHAAALCLRDQIPTHALRGEEIRHLLNRDGAQLD